MLARLFILLIPMLLLVSDVGAEGLVGVERVNVTPSGALGNAGAYESTISADGTMVAFMSYASDIVEGDSNNRADIFVRDLQANYTERMNVDPQGNELQKQSGFPVISGDGTQVAFNSSADNIVADDTNGTSDVFVRDLNLDKTVRVSVRTDGSEAGSGGLVNPPALSHTGRFVVFESYSDFSLGDLGVGDIFIHDRDTDEDGVFDEAGSIATELVSRSSSGDPGNGGSYAPAISADGRYVAYSSGASNLVEGDAIICGSPPGQQYNCYDVFLFDRQSEETTLVSASEAGAYGNSDSHAPTLSANGRFVTFTSAASNLVLSDDNGFRDIFVWNRIEGTIDRASVNSGGQEGNGQSCPVLGANLWACAFTSNDGNVVVFGSEASNLGANDTNCLADLFIRDRALGTTSRLSEGPGGEQLNGISLSPHISEPPSFLTFTSYASDLSPAPKAPVIDVFVSALDVGTVSAATQNLGSVHEDCRARTGDIDCDGVLTEHDVLEFLRYLGGLVVRPDCLTSLGNVGCYFHPEIDARDVLQILHRLAGFIDSLPYCTGGG